MKAKLVMSTLVLGVGLAMGASAHAESACKGLSKGKCGTGCTWVDSYKTKTGNTVNGYCRTKPGKAGAAAAVKGKAAKAGDKVKSGAKEKAAKAKGDMKDKAKEKVEKAKGKMKDKAKEKVEKAKSKVKDKAQKKIKDKAKKQAKDKAKGKMKDQAKKLKDLK